MSAFSYRPEVDGLRAISVMAVILFHANFGCPGGFVGVDVFFVISGFLITSLILNDVEKNAFSLKDFWIRRIRRIVPAASIMVLLTLIAGYFLLLPEDLIGLGKSAIAQSFMGSNFYFWSNGGYFARNSETEPLLHTWSLAVEEQFYLVFPLLILLLSRTGPRRLGAAMWGIAAVSMAISVYGVYRSPSATFYLLPTRAWEMLAGSLVALQRQSSRPKYVAEMMAWVGLMAIGLAIGQMSRETVFPGAAALIPVAGAALFIWGNTGQSTSIGRLLSIRPLVFVGRISYSLYLWHWPVFAFLRYLSDAEEPSIEQRCLALMISGLLAVAAWWLVEEPIRRRVFFTSTPRLLTSVGFTTLALLAVSGSMIQMVGFPHRIPSHWQLFRDAKQGVALKTNSGDLLTLGQESPDEKFSFIVWGDSHANVAAPEFGSVAEQLGIQGINAARGGRPPIPGTYISWDKKLSEWNSEVLSFIKTHRIPHVFLVARWSQFIEGPTPYDQLNGRGFTDPLLRCSASEKPTRETSEACLRSGLEHLINELEESGCTIWIVQQVPDQNHDVLRRAFLENQGLSLSGHQVPLSQDDFEQRQRRVNALIAGVVGPNVRLIDLSRGMFDREGIAITSSNGVPLYRDNSHLSAEGSKLFIQPVVEKVLANLTNSKPSAPSSISREPERGNPQK
jgi:peptidoglycan/LPS O-acetylase OafA/YrhL